VIRLTIVPLSEEFGASRKGAADLHEQIVNPAVIGL
jgi:hypothetical protein